MGGRGKALLLAAATAALAGCGESATPDDAVEAIRPPGIARVRSAREAVEGARIRTLDPGTMNDAQITRAIGPGPRCQFRYTSAGKPVLAMAVSAGGVARQAVLKVNGDLVLLAPVEGGRQPAGATVLAADPIRVSIRPVADGREAEGRQEAEMIFEIGEQLRVGYRGYLGCPAEGRSR